MDNNTDLPREYRDGWTEFLNCHIDLSLHPLIPRPETEYWVEQAIKKIRLEPKVKVLDLFSGSGCIGIALATHCPNAEVMLADIKNYISTPLPNNAHFIQSDLFSNIPGKFDFILANPPYVAEGSGVAGIMNHEPHSALYAGPDGLDIIRPFLAQAPAHLLPGGQIWLEFGSDQKSQVEKLLQPSQLLNSQFHRDQYSRWRYLVITN